MISKDSRKAATRDFKQREPNRGVFAVQCTASGRRWVGAAMDLGAARNQIWFAARLGMHREATLQADWNAHGEASFEFETLERLDPELSDLRVRDELKARKAHWAQALGAPALL
jgi:hypothetical protein